MIGSTPCVGGVKLTLAWVLLGFMGLLAGCSGSVERSSSLNTGEEIPDPDPAPVPDPDPDPDLDPDPDPDPSPAPAINLRSGDDVVDSGASTTLSWTTQDADSCTATGGWSGNKSTSGSETVGPISANTTYNLTCTSSGGNALVMITVFVNGTVQLSWIAPTENVDGTALTNLAGYKIYYGPQPGGYVDSVDLNDTNITEFDLTVPMGTYYLALTALDSDGNESGYSNEVVKNSI